MKKFNVFATLPLLVEVDAENEEQATEIVERMKMDELVTYVDGFVEVGTVEED